MFKHLLLQLCEAAFMADVAFHKHQAHNIDAQVTRCTTSTSVYTSARIVSNCIDMQPQGSCSLLLLLLLLLLKQCMSVTAGAALAACVINTNEHRVLPQSPHHEHHH